MKRHFITGLVILLPIALTFMIVAFLVNLLTKPFEGIVLIIWESFGPSLNGSHWVPLATKGLVLLFLFCVTLLMGFFAKALFVRYMLFAGDVVLHRIPIVNTIYRGAKDVVQTVFGEKKSKFSHVVLVPFPHSKALNIGLVTGSLEEHEGVQDRVSVFVPGTPNPTMGFMLMYRKDQMIPIGMTVEEALKFVISCGVIFTSFHKTEALVQSD